MGKFLGSNQHLECWLLKIRVLNFGLNVFQLLYGYSITKPDYNSVDICFGGWGFFNYFRAVEVCGDFCS